MPSGKVNCEEGKSQQSRPGMAISSKKLLISFSDFDMNIFLLRSLFGLFRFVAVIICECRLKDPNQNKVHFPVHEMDLMSLITSLFTRCQGWCQDPKMTERHAFVPEVLGNIQNKWHGKKA
jgi:hypothetical protein